MAAVHPPESPKRQKYPVDDVETSEQKTEAVDSADGVIQRDETTCNKSAEIPGDEPRASVGNDGGCIASHSEVSVESSAGTDKTTCNSSQEQASPEKMAEVSGSEQRAFDWSEAEDDGDEAKLQQAENTECDVAENVDKVQQGAQADDNVTADAEDVHEVENSLRRTESEQANEPVGEANKAEDVAEEDEEAEKPEDADLAAKQKKCRLICKECGKRFTRRETFNLHRHFHAHEDELTPLTCKECGLTFQHRSSLIKHRNEHKQKEEELVVPKKEVQTKEEGSFECAECGRIFSTVVKLRDHNCSSTVDKPYHCPLCRQDFQFKFSVTRHMVTHSQERMFTCQECDHKFPDATTLRYHQRCHSALKPFECPECGMVFKHFSVMEDHRRKHADNTRLHLCTICGKTFKYGSLLHQHQYLHTGQKPFRCPECGKNFAFAQNMKAHCRQHRLRKTDSSNSSDSSEQQPCKQALPPTQDTVKGLGKENSHQSEELKRTFKCPLCPQTCSAPANLRTHMVFHEAEYETLKSPKENNKHWGKCPHCPCVYRDYTSLKLHIFSFHKSVAQDLEKMATSPPNKQVNLSSSDDVQGKGRSDGISSKSYKCSECGKMFRHRSVLELHMRIHSKDKPYQCKVCGKGFRFSSYLQQHLIIHTGKKPYKCPDCGKDFAFLQNMRTHQKLHQEKPFRCTSCRKGYSDETQLQQHMVSHYGDKPHKCDLCDKSFGLAYLLRDHMNTHTGERPHRCDECDKTFSWFSSLLVHQKIHARKRQSFSQNSSFPLSSRMRGSSSGKREDRLVWSSSRPLGGSVMGNSESSPFPDSALRDSEVHSKAVQPQSSMVSPHMDLQSKQQKEQSMSDLNPQPVQWKVDAGKVMPIPSSQHQHATQQQARFDSSLQQGLQQHHQRSPGWADIPLITQSGSISAQSSEPSHLKENATSTVGSHPTFTPNKSSPLAVSEVELHRQPQPKSITLSSTPMSIAVASSSSLQHDFSVPSYIDGAALWSIRPLANSQSSPNKIGQELQLSRWQNTLVSTQKEPSTPLKNEDKGTSDITNSQVMPLTVSQPERQWSSGLAGASTSAQVDQSSAIPISTPVSLGIGSTVWDLQALPGIPKTIQPPQKLVNNQDIQVSSGWPTVQCTAQKVPISTAYEAHRFGQGIGTTVWSFQSNTVGPQTLLTGQLKPGKGQELQQQPIVTGTQLIINQPSPFFAPTLAALPPLALPGPHPLHSVAVGALPRPSHPNIFFTPQAVMSERPHLTQTLPISQLAPRTEPPKLGTRLPFAPDRLLQCMICGRSFPRELELQMHYLQHAQGEI
ncbi:MDS1 and EVI1 complex locus isoform X1 [Solea senegalensis]|uniref:MDS1 and EVI1 complex locus isoform X1 n=1 Tax=Solea senegalensis TaxID=28829 RepID=A0AAV6PQH2_SOLSE|nr:uncharacterized protein zgc:66448 [Solea senegalensis]KAG7475051.1 MDS1 and EVI1 complex locus isoform X1 [Solea senegalensis]